MKKMFALILLALVVCASTGCKSGLFSKWRRGAQCSQCGPTGSQNVSYSPSYDVPYATAGSDTFGTGVEFAPAYDAGSSSHGVLPTPPGPVGFGN